MDTSEAPVKVTGQPSKCSLCPHFSTSSSTNTKLQEMTNVRRLDCFAKKLKEIRKKNEDHRELYSCGICGLRFQNSSSSSSKLKAAEHYKNCKLQDPEKFVCVSCKSEFSTRDEIMKHQIGKHVSREKLRHYSERFYNYLENEEGEFIR